MKKNISKQFFHNVRQREVFLCFVFELKVSSVSFLGHTLLRPLIMYSALYLK